MALFTPRKLTFKRSKKQHQILAQTAYYQAGKIVVQTILPEQPPVALITLNTLGTTCSTSADTYIPIENIFNTQSCSFLESRLVSLYGGKAASLLIEYQQRLNSLQVEQLTLGEAQGLKFKNLSEETRRVRVASVASEICTKSRRIPFGSPVRSSRSPVRDSLQVAELTPHTQAKSSICKELRLEDLSEDLDGVNSANTTSNRWQSKEGFMQLRDQKLAKQKTDKKILVQSKEEELSSVPQRGKHISFSGKSSGKSSSRRRPPTRKLPLGYAKLRGTATCKKLRRNSLQIKDLSGIVLTNCLNEAKAGSKALAYNTETKLINNVTQCQTCFAGAGNNIFQSTLGNIEIQTASRLARIMVNYWNFYSLNKSSLYSIFEKDVPTDQLNALHSNNKASINSINKLANFPLQGDPRTVAKVMQLTPCQAPGLRPRAVARDDLRAFANVNSFTNTRINHYLLQYLPQTNRRALTPQSPTACTGSDSLLVRGLQQRNVKFDKQLNYVAKQSPLQVAQLRSPQKGNAILAQLTPHTQAKYKSSICKKICKELRRGDPKEFRRNCVNGMRGNNLYFAIAQSKNSLKICESSGTANSSYNIQRLSIENIGNYSQLNNNNFQLLNSLQSSNLQRDRFYPNWFRLYLPDMEATEFLKNVANYYFSLGLQTFTFPSTKFSYYSVTSCTSAALKRLQVAELTPSGLRLEDLSEDLYPEGFALKGVANVWVTPQSPTACTGYLSHFDFGKLVISTASPFLTFLNKNTQKEKFISTIISYTYCPPSVLINFTSDKSINSRFAMNDVILNPLQVAKLTPWETQGLKLEDLVKRVGVSISHSELTRLPLQSRVLDPFNANPFRVQLVKHQRNKLAYTFHSQTNLLTNRRTLTPQYPTADPEGVSTKSASLPSMGVGGYGGISGRGIPKELCQRIVLTNCVNEMHQQKEARPYKAEEILMQSKEENFILQAPGIMGVDYIKDPSFIKAEEVSETHIPGGQRYRYPLNVPFSLLLENQIFPLNYNGFSTVEKELLYNALVNSSFAKAFYLINQNRQLLDFFVDYLLRFQILRQHQILYLFSTLLLGCNKTT